MDMGSIGEKLAMLFGAITGQLEGAIREEVEEKAKEFIEEEIKPLGEHGLPDEIEAKLKAELKERLGALALAAPVIAEITDIAVGWAVKEFVYEQLMEFAEKINPDD